MTKTYTISERAFTQGPLTLSRLQRLTGLLTGMGLAGQPGTGGLAGSLRALFDRLTSADLPTEFFQIILTGPAAEVCWADVDANELVEVVEDFFVLNSKIVLKLSSSFRGLLTTLGATTPTLRSLQGSTESPAHSAEK